MARAVAGESRAALAALDGVEQQGAILWEDGRQGQFVYDTSDLTDLVAADPLQALYVPPASDPTGASGAWVRQFNGPLDVRWFGAIADDATDAAPAINAAFTLAGALATTGLYSPTIFRGGPRIHIPTGDYYIESPLEPLVTCIIEGDGGLGWGAGTRIRSAPGINAVIFQAYNTEGDDEVSANHFAGDAIVLRDIYFYGAFASGDEAEAHGLLAKRAFHVERCTFDNFEGDGIHAWVNFTGGAPYEGNVNASRIINCTLQGNRSGIMLRGADANACMIMGCSYMYNRSWGRDDSSFLGNHEFGSHYDGNGVSAWSTGEADRPACYVSHGGYQYACVVGQEAWCSANAPTGAETDNQGWYYWRAGGAMASIPAWFNGIEVRGGGPMLLSGINGKASAYGCHIEINSLSQLGTRCTMMGGNNAGVIGNGGGSVHRFPNVVEGTDLGFHFQGGARFDGDVLMNRDVSIGDGTDAAAIRIRYNTGGNILYYGAGGAFHGQEAMNSNWAMLHHLSQVNISIGTAFGYVDKLSVYETLAQFSVPVNLTAGNVYRVGGTQVVGTQGAAVADATDAATAITQLNTLLARMRAHGLIAT